MATYKTKQNKLVKTIYSQFSNCIQENYANHVLLYLIIAAYH